VHRRGTTPTTQTTHHRNMDYKQFDSSKKFASFELKKISKGRTHSWDDFQNTNEKGMLTKELIESMSERVQSAYAEYREYKEAHSGSFQMEGFDSEFSPDRTFYNEHGNEVIFMEVHGTRFDDTVRMNIRTHDVIRGDDGSDVIHSGWGRDIIIGGQEATPAADHMYGGEGRDSIWAYNLDKAYGENGDDMLFGWGDSELHGGEDNDTFRIRNGGSPDTTPSIADLTQEDRVDVFMTNQSQFTGIHPNDNGTYTIMTSNGPGTVLDVESLDGFDIEVSRNQTRVIITGSEFL